MAVSFYKEYLEKNMAGLVVALVKKINDTNQAPGYMFKKMLTPQLSISGKWEALSTLSTLIMADVVAMDSPLPLKNRDSISKASGDIPKMGIELSLNERQLKDLDTLVALGGNTQDILGVIFKDTPKVITAIYERLEAIFLQALSTGVALVDDDKNVGTGIRLDFGHPAVNKFGVVALWSNPVTAKPMDDIQRVLDKAVLDGNIITTVKLDKTAFNNLAKTDQAKQIYAFGAGFVGANIPAPSISQLNTVLQDRFGFSFELIDRSVRYEKNGAQVAYKPWSDGAIVFLTQDNVGTLAYTTLAEENRPVAGVTYTKADSYILVSKYSENKPSLAEFTSSQAMVIPVIANVANIYIMDTKTLQA